MQRAENQDMEIGITRMGSDPQTVIVPEKSTLEEVLDAAEITLSASETAWVSGDKANMNDIIEDGDTIQLVGKKEGGLR